MLPKFFKTRNYSSFVRQLNMYGFSKVKNTSGHHEFKHKYFRRGHRKDLALIKRKMNNGEGETGEPSAELKNLQLEYQRVKQASAEFEDSLKVLVKQNKKLMEANRQLVYQFYYFKKESDLKAQKILFLFYSLVMNSSPAIQDFMRKAFMNKVYPKEIVEQVIKKVNGPSFFEDLDERRVNGIDGSMSGYGAGSIGKKKEPAELWKEINQSGNESANGGKSGVMGEMMKNLFKGTGPETQYVDEMINQFLELKKNNSVHTKKESRNFQQPNHGVSDKNSEMGMTIRSKPGIRHFPFNESKMSGSNQPFSMHFKRPHSQASIGRPLSFQSKPQTHTYKDILKNPSIHSEKIPFLNDNVSRSNIIFSKNNSAYENGSRISHERMHHSHLLESIENKLTNFNFGLKKHH